MAAAHIIVPTHSHPRLLPFALRSAQAQTIDDLVITVVGDGVDDDTRDALAPFLDADRRIRFRDRPKAGRTGEPHRGPVILDEPTEVVTYLSDDDLLLPDHVEHISAALADADFAHPLPGGIHVDGSLHMHPVDLSAEPWRHLHQVGRSGLVPLTGTSHRRSAYLRLPVGWSDTPVGAATDHHMWRKFVEQPWCRIVSSWECTTIRLPAASRRTFDDDTRVDELARWAARIADADSLASFRREVDLALRARFLDDRLMVLLRNLEASAET